MAYIHTIEKDRICDMHTHSGAPDLANKMRNFYPHVQSVAELKRKLRRTGVWAAVTFPFPNTSFYDPDKYNQRKELVVSGTQTFPYQQENAALLEQCEGRDTILPFACIDPKHKADEQLEFLEMAIQSQKPIYGLKMHSYAVQAEPQQLVETGFVDFARQHNIPILFHTGTDTYSLPEKALSLGQQYPDLRICMAHMAQFREEIITVASQHTNVFIDCCPLLFLHDMAKEGSRWVAEPNTYCVG